MESGLCRLQFRATDLRALMQYLMGDFLQSCFCIQKPNDISPLISIECRGLGVDAGGWISAPVS